MTKSVDLNKAQVRSFENPSFMTDLDSLILEIDNQYGLFNEMGLFETKGIASETITFEKDIRNTTLIPQTSRRGGKPATGTDRKVETYTLTAPYFLIEDYVSMQDIQGYRQTGEEGRPKLVAEAVAEKAVDLKANVDQTIEYMKVQAIKGITKDAYGNTIADMFSEFGLAGVRNTDIDSDGFQLNFELNVGTTDVLGKIRKLKRYIAKKAKGGTPVGDIQVACSTSFFDALVAHPSVVDAYNQFASNDANGNYLRQGTQDTVKDYGIVSRFYFGGVYFYAYDAEFNIDNGDGTFTVEAAFADNEAYTVCTNVKGAYRGAFAPANTLSSANVLGQEMYMRTFTDPKDRYIELEAETAPLFWLAKPQLSIRLIAQ